MIKKTLIWIGLLLVLLILIAYLLFAYTNSKLAPMDEAARAKAPGQHINLTDGQVHYRWDGPLDGPVMVMVHGFSTPNFIFEQNVQALTDAGFRVLRFDHFGRGWSDRPDVRYSVDFYDRELLELLDQLKITEPVGLVGLSMGGPITAEFTARHPERVRKLFLFVPAGFATASTSKLTTKILGTPVIGDWVWGMIARKTLLSDPQYDESSLTPENQLAGDVTEQMDYKGYFPALLSTFRHLPMTDREETFARLRDTGVPVQAVFGDADATIPVASADRLKTQVPNALVRILEGGAHGLNYQRHREVNPWLLDWFKMGKDSNP